MAAVLEALHRVVQRQDLTEADASRVLSEILEGASSPTLIGALLTALRVKGETVDEIAGFARAMRSHAVKIPLTTVQSSCLVDTCGTGGDGLHTFNISTVSAFVVAGAGGRVAKHGNRSISSRCGSADVLEALGANVRLAPESVAACIETVGIGFLFAPLVHSAMRYVQPIRAELKMRTIFNLLGPLTNPTGAAAQVVGVFDDKLVVPVAQVLCRLGASRAFVVHGSDGLDEITLTGPTHIAEVAAGEIRERTVEPRDFGLSTVDAGDLVAGDREANAEIMRAILDGQPGPKRDIVVANAAAALVAAGKAQDFHEGARQAGESLTAGKAREKLDEFVRFTNRFPAA